MEDIRYIYRCVCQALALEEAEVVSKATRLANLRYIKQQIAELVPPQDIKEADQRANATVTAIKDRR